jgi:hypothetical protein
MEFEWNWNGIEIGMEITVQEYGNHGIWKWKIGIMKMVEFELKLESRIFGIGIGSGIVIRIGLQNDLK